jgi:Holliday junction resolvase-like predicted endonuclease
MSGLGAWGESRAADFLKAKKASILYANYFIRPFGEIDIVAREYGGTLLFVEVKTMVDPAPHAGLVPEDHLGRSKLRKLMRMGEMFSAKHPELVDPRKGWRIDLIAISVPDSSLTYIDSDVIIRHYDNIVSG